MLTGIRRSRPVRTLVRRLGVHRVTAAVGVVQAPFVLVSALVLRRLPRDRSLVALGSTLDRFADNAAYLYLHLSERERTGHAGLRPVWVSGSGDVVRRLRAQGYRAVTRWSPSGIWAALRASVFVYSGYRSDINRWLAPGARTVCLWHGLPIKRVEGAVGGPGGTGTRWLRRLLQAAREPAPDHLLTPSEFVVERFSPAFGVPRERCWQLGYPRNDHLLRDPKAPPRALVADPESWSRLEQASVVVGLFLTWRDDRVDDVVDAALLAELTDCCSRAGGLLAYKAHFNVTATDAAPTGERVELPADVDLHAYLGLCDVLVTDYSSVALDFLLLGRPVVYFMPDLEQYDARRGFHLDPLALPGVVTRDRASLVEELTRTLMNLDDHRRSERDAAFLVRLWGPDPAEASAAIAVALDDLAGSRDRRVSSRPPASPVPPARRAAG
jgi:CDP-glycerol glycerophosphotransferase (TagB/SpsB family)